MGNYSININTDAFVVLANRLEKISRYALPVAIRGALNDTVKNVKQVTMPESAAGNFTQRQKNFFVANSKFESATGFNINNMVAKVGFYENKLKHQSTNFAVKDLEQQEIGGKIGGKAFIPLDKARVGGKGNVRANARLRDIKAQKIVDSKKSQGATKVAKFKSSAKFAGVGGFVIHENILWGIDSIAGNVKATPLYSVVGGRSISVNSTHFMKEATDRSAKKMQPFYIIQAKKQLAKYYGKL